MDGASKFVRGDAIAGLIITGINLVGGVIMGLMRGMDIASATRVYSVLTIGDSLVSQLPAFIIAIASGILVTKATSQSSLGQEIGVQFIGNSQSLAIGSAILFGLALMPGLPKLPFLALAAGLWWLMLRARQTANAVKAPTAAEGDGTTPAITTERALSETIIDDFLHADRVGIEIGARLIPFAKTEHGNLLVERVMSLRRATWPRRRRLGAFDSHPRQYPARSQRLSLLHQWPRGCERQHSRRRLPRPGVGRTALLTRRRGHAGARLWSTGEMDRRNDKARAELAGTPSSMRSAS